MNIITFWFINEMVFRNVPLNMLVQKTCNNILRLFKNIPVKKHYPKSNKKTKSAKGLVHGRISGWLGKDLR